MPSITFNFRAQVPPEERRKVLDEIAAWEQVLNASLLKPDATNPLLQKMAYATLKETADPDAVLKKLSKLAQIESASIPPRRKLI